MEPLPYTHAGAKIVFYIAIGLFVVLEWRIRLRSHLDRDGSRPERMSLVVVYLAVLLGVAGGFVLAGVWKSAAITSVRWPLFIAGMTLIVVGIAIRQWAIIVLGRFFTIDVRVQPGQSVVERGPYRWVAHPAYTGMILSFIGMGLVLGNWAALTALALAPTVGLLVRIRFEERILIAGLGEPYRTFLGGRPRLFPRVWWPGRSTIPGVPR